MTLSISTQIRSRQQEDVRTAELGKIRLGDSSITAKLPVRRRSYDARTADPGIVKVGDSSITAKLPAKS